MKLINKLTGKKIQLVKIKSSFRTSKSHYDLLTFDEEIQLELYGACETVLAINTEDRLKPMPSNMTISEWVKANSYSLKSTDIEIVILDGKHSETDADIDIKINLTIEEFNHLISNYADMNCLIDVLADKLGVDSRNLSDFKRHFEQHILSISKQLNPDDLALVESVNKLDLKVIAELINNQKVIEHLKIVLK